MAFDPDKYIAEKTKKEFNPDKYLTDKNQEGSLSKIEPSQIEAFLRSGAQGATFDNADEIAGGVEAGLDTITGKSNLSDLMDTYRKHRDESRANFKAAEEAHPITSAIGNLAGGFLTAIPLAAATGGAAPVAEAATLGSKLIHGMKTGAALGALSGLGSSEDSSTLGNVKDAAWSGLTGAGLGAGLSGAGHAIGNLVTDTKTGKGLLDTFRLARGGEKLAGLKNAERISAEAVNLPGNILESIDNERKIIGGAQKAVRTEFDSANPKLDLQNFWENKKAQVEAINDQGLESLKKDKEQLLGYITRQMNATKVSKPNEENALETLQKRISNLLADAEPGISISGPIVEDSENGLKRAVASVTSPESEVKGVNAKYIGPDGEEGEILGDLNKKRAVQNVKSVEMGGEPVANTPARTVTDEVTGDKVGVFSTSKTIPEDTSIMSKSFVEDPLATLKDTTRSTEDLASLVSGHAGGDLSPSGIVTNAMENPNMKDAVNSIANDVKGLINTATGGEEGGYRGLYHHISDAVRTFSPETADVSPAVADENFKKGILRAINSYNKYTGTAPEEKVKFQKFIAKIAEINPELASNIEEKVKTMSSKVNATSMGIDESRLQSHTLGLTRSGLTNLTSFAGNAYGAVEGSGVGKLAGGMYNLPGKALKGLADSVATKGETGQKLAGMLNKVVDQDSKARNAVMFVIMQNPVYRQLLGLDK